MSEQTVFTVGEFVSVLNQTLEYAYPNVTVTGEVANFKISKNKWVYFDLKDETASVRFFGTTYQLPGPIEDGMLLVVRGVPKLHPLYGFSVTVQSMRPSGKGSIKKAAALLEAKLRAEGLFELERKRPLPYCPTNIALITSGESAAYHDFMKILNARWGGVHISHIDVQVQGEAAVDQIVNAIRQANELPTIPEMIILIRGGGSADDLQAFSTEQVTRAVAGSRVPTLVAIGHEIDISLAELAADVHASTPSNAAELMVPDRKAIMQQVQSRRQLLHRESVRIFQEAENSLVVKKERLLYSSSAVFSRAKEQLVLQSKILAAYNPDIILRRGYALVRRGESIVHTTNDISIGQAITIQLDDGTIDANVTDIKKKEKEL